VVRCLSEKMSNKIQGSIFCVDALLKLSRVEFDKLFSKLPYWIVIVNEEYMTARSTEEADALKVFYSGDSESAVACRDFLPPLQLPAELLKVSAADLAELLFVPDTRCGGWTHSTALDALWEFIHLNQPRVPAVSSTLDNVVNSLAAGASNFSVAPPRDDGASSSDKSEEPELDGEPIAVVRRVKISQIHASADGTLKEVLDIVGPAVWCAWVGRTKELPSVARQGKRVTAEQLDKHAQVLRRLNPISASACSIFFTAYVKGALSILLEDVFGALTNERSRILECDGFCVTTLVSRYDFSSPVVERLQIKDSELLDENSSTLAALRAKVARMPIPQKVGDVLFSKAEIFGIYAMFFHRAYGGEKVQTGLEALPSGNFYYMLPQLVNDGKGNMSLQNKVVVVSMPVVELSQNFQQHKASAAVAYLAGKYGPDYRPDLTLVYGGEQLDIADWYMQMVGYNVDDNLKVGHNTGFHGFGLALQRARNLRKGTMMDAEYKNNYAFMKLCENYFVKYDGTLCVVLHAIAKFSKQVCDGHVKRALVCLDKSANSLTVLSLLNTIRQERGLDIKVYFPNGSPDNADGFHQGTDPLIVTSYPGRYLTGVYDKDTLVQEVSSSLIWICNPANGNDYISLGKMKDVESVVFSNLVKCAYDVYRIISFATSMQINAATDTFKLLYGDVKSPFTHYWTESGEAVEIVNSVTRDVFVPIGHAPHTTQRLAYYQVRGEETVVRITPPIVGTSADRLNKFQIKECLAFSQHRFQMLGGYQSDEIMSLGLKRAVQVLEQNDTVASSDF